MKRLPALALLLAAPVPAWGESVPVVPEPVGILGHMVESRTSKDIGRVVDILVDHDGRPQAAVLDVGGFLGLGNRKVVVAWRALHFSVAGGGDLAVMIDVSSDRIKAAPAYEAGKPVNALAADATD